MILDEIIKDRKRLLDLDRRFYDILDVKINVKDQKPLSKSILEKGISIISEIKPSSPSLGRIRSIHDIKKLALEMERAGVIGLSVLTEPVYFHGSYNNLKIVIKSINLPCLMKDFIIDEIQIKIASKLGATNVLLVNLIGNLEEMYEKCLDYGIEPLIEIHSEEEIKDIKNLRSIGFNPKLIGINNRNLKTMEIDLNNSKLLIPKIKDIFGQNIKVISESGLKTREDIDYVREFGADAVLIGSSIMQSINVYEKILSLRRVI
ncbi:MAG: indole-3-glycerol-phosphate synthase [Candidatus Lokiarchaeota archaeon]|nr:indole-3-glycerol-phosphate synthase [Candidatus Lokiarchaeota archaeon]